MLRTTENPNPLTTRERQVLMGLSDGRTYDAIADQLGLSHDSVKNYARAAYERLDARNRTHAVAISIRRGYILPPQNRPKST